MPPPPWRYISAQRVCPTNIGIDHLSFEKTDTDIGRLTYYPHIAIRMVVLVSIPPPEPIVRITSGPYVKTPPPFNDTLAFADGVMQAIIKGGAKWREGKGPTNSTLHDLTPYETCIINYTALRHPSGARRFRDCINKGRVGAGRERAGDVILQQKALYLIRLRRDRGDRGIQNWHDGGGRAEQAGNDGSVKQKKESRKKTLAKEVRRHYQREVGATQGVETVIGSLGGCGQVSNRAASLATSLPSSQLARAGRETELLPLATGTRTGRRRCWPLGRGGAEDETREQEAKSKRSKT